MCIGTLHGGVWKQQRRWRSRRPWLLQKHFCWVCARSCLGVVQEQWTCYTSCLDCSCAHVADCILHFVWRCSLSEEEAAASSLPSPKQASKKSKARKNTTKAGIPCKPPATDDQCSISEVSTQQIHSQQAKEEEPQPQAEQIHSQQAKEEEPQPQAELNEVEKPPQAEAELKFIDVGALNQEDNQAGASKKKKRKKKKTSKDLQEPSPANLPSAGIGKTPSRNLALTDSSLSPAEMPGAPALSLEPKARSISERRWDPAVPSKSCSTESETPESRSRDSVVPNESWIESSAPERRLGESAAPGESWIESAAPVSWGVGVHSEQFDPDRTDNLVVEVNNSAPAKFSPHSTSPPVSVQQPAPAPTKYSPYSAPMLASSQQPHGHNTPPPPLPPPPQSPLPVERARSAGVGRMSSPGQQHVPLEVKPLEVEPERTRRSSLDSMSLRIRRPFFAYVTPPWSGSSLSSSVPDAHQLQRNHSGPMQLRNTLPRS
eukprot:3181703-Pyramimonas_sp.AAC.1